MGESKRKREFYGQPPEHRLGDAPVEAEYHDAMTGIMQALDEILNGPKGPRYVKKTGIIVLMFPYNDHGGRCNFMSNGADRADVVTMLKEMIARFEGQPEMGGRA